MHCHLQAPDPDERAVVMLKSRHLQLVSSLQQELEQLKQANQEQASYVSEHLKCKHAAGNCI